MSTVLEAGYAYASDDDGVIIVGFADSQYDTKQFVLLQRDKDPSVQDRAIGRDQVHIAVDDESRSTYGGVHALEFEPGLVRISLDPDAARLLGTDQEIMIRFGSSGLEQATLVTRLRELFAKMPGSLRIRL